VPTHYAIRRYGAAPGGGDPKSWLVDTFTERRNCQELERKENNMLRLREGSAASSDE
jgi:hypothetical protein